ncbi:MAG: hypothetical protein AB7L13_05900 [Acidimicrobiia bacterium]
MSGEEVWDFLAGQSAATVCGRSAERLTGRRARIIAVDGDARRLELELVPDVRTFDLAAHPQLCVCVDVYPSAADLKAVIAHGPGVYVGDARISFTAERVVSFDFSKASA